MFSLKEKQYLSSEIERLILGLGHPEMPKDKPMFSIRIEGKESWSWAEIKPNWTFGIDNPPKVNPFNEISRQVLSKEDNQNGT